MNGEIIETEKALVSARAKNDEYDPVDPYLLHQFAFTQFHLLGDPGLTVWTDDPEALTVSHAAELDAGQPAVFTVDVADGGGPVTGATVCLWKDGDVYEVGETSGGAVSFPITPATEGTLLVTVCAQNCLPYEGETVVNPDPTGVAALAGGARGALALVSIRPNPFRPGTDILFAVPACGGPANVRLDVYDTRGRLVRTLVDASLSAGTHTARWDGTDAHGAKVAAGVYFCELRRGGETRSAKLVRVK